MKLTFLGTAASEGYPDAFCDCANCTRARQLGGPNLRKRCAALVDNELLIDLGPDLLAAAQVHGVSLAGLRYCLQTHEHADHLDPNNFFARSIFCGVVGLPRLHFYAVEPVYQQIDALIPNRLPPTGLRDPTMLEKLNLTPHVIEPGETFTAGPYRVLAVPANHGGLVAVLFVVEREGRALFYATDTGPLPEAAWQMLRAAGVRLHVVAMDHTFGLSQPRESHLNLEQFVKQVDRLRAEGLLADGARIFGYHFAHHSNPVHPELVELAAKHGYEVAYDGFVVEV